jgi:DNA polymerase elongation subunit (family B)
VEDEWLWGWDDTPGIVSVWADDTGNAWVWRRDPQTGVLTRDDVRFRPWVLLDRLDDLAHLGDRLLREGEALRANTFATYRELEGTGTLKYHVSAESGRALTAAVLEGAARRLNRPLHHVRDLDDKTYLSLAPDEQYLVATGRTYFKDLSFDQLHRLQFDLETTGLEPERDRIFMVSVRHPDGRVEILEAPDLGDRGEADLIRQLVATIKTSDPDVIENHNLHGFDVPFLETRARKLRVPLELGRIGGPGLKQRGAMRGTPSGRDDGRRVRYVAPGRELVDTMDAVRRHDFSARDLPGHGLKVLARHFGISGPDRELIPGAEIYATYLTDPARVRRYAAADVEEVAALSRLLGGAAFALSQMAPRRYERLADTGAATGVIDPLLVRAYMRAGRALPAHEAGDGTVHSGAALHLFATGVAHRVVKADVASLYPSLMRAYRIGPDRDTLGALLALVDRLVAWRLNAKGRARAALQGSTERYTNEAISAAIKIVVNSAYGYMASGDLTRFADVHAANEVTRRGRETLALMCRELAARGVTLIEADTDGVYFAVPETWTEADERRVVSEVAALFPALVQLEFEGRYTAMLSHEPKNYALLGYNGELVLRGVAFRSSRAEPYGEHFLRRAIGRLLVDDIVGVREVYLETLDALRQRSLPTREVSSRVRLTKSPDEYMASRESRRELAYEALLAARRTRWRVGERVRVYRARNGMPALAPELEDDDASVDGADPRDYDVEHYARLLRETFAVRLARAFTPEDFAVVFANPDQLALFTPPVSSIKSVLHEL